MWPLGPATRFPGCINDEDIPGSMTIADLGPPVQDPGRFTRMTMQLVRFNASLCVRRIINPAAAPGVGSRSRATKRAGAEGSSGGEWDEEEELRREVKEDLDAMVERNESFYLRYCDDGDDETTTNSSRGGGGSTGDDNGDDDIPALKKMTKAAGRMVEAKLRMMYYHRFIKNKKSSPDHESWELRKSIITKSLHLLHHRTTLLSDPTLAPYHWHIKVHTYFHAAFHILSELCTPEFLGGGEEIRELSAKAWEVIGGMDWSCGAGEDKGGMGIGRGKEREVLRRLRERAQRMEVGGVRAVPGVQEGELEYYGSGNATAQKEGIETGLVGNSNAGTGGDADGHGSVDPDLLGFQHQQGIWPTSAGTHNELTMDTPDGTGVVWIDPDESIYDADYPFGQVNTWSWFP